MSIEKQRLCLCLSVCWLVASSATSAAQTIALVPVSSTGPYTLSGGTITVPEGGVVITLEILVSGWGSAPGAPKLGYYQATIDSTGYSSGGLSLVPVGWPASNIDGCFLAGAVCATSGRDCSDGQPPCTGPEGACGSNPRFVLSCCDPIWDTSTVTLDYEYAAVSQFEGAIDPGPGPNRSTYGYAGTLKLSVPGMARGFYSIGFDPFNSVMSDEGGRPIPIFSLVDALIQVGDFCAGGPNVGTFCASDSICVEAGWCGAKNRYLSFRTVNPAQKSIRVQCTNSPVAGAVGLVRWAGPPTTAADTASSDFVAAKAMCFPTTRNWATVGRPIHIYGPAIVPGSTYAVFMCDADGVSNCAIQGTFRTAKWGDVTLPFATTNFQDVAAVVAKFQGKPQAPGRNYVQLQPELIVPGNAVNFQQVSAAVSAFQGHPYPYTSPATCP